MASNRASGFWETSPTMNRNYFPEGDDDFEQQDQLLEDDDFDGRTPVRAHWHVLTRRD